MERALGSRQRVVARCVRWGLPAGVSVLTLWLLAKKIGPDELSGMVQSLQQVSPVQILAALLLSGISLWAVGRYDLVAHRHLQTGIDGGAARRSGMAAVALAQALGFGLLTGALVRWRMLPNLDMALALKLSAFVCLSFIGALAVVLAVAALVLPAPAGFVIPALAVLMLLPVILWLLLRHPVLQVGPITLRLPTLPAVGAILLWAVLDTTAAAAAFYIVFPDSAPGFAVFLPVFLCALAAGLLSGVPGGVGPFDLTLLALLPQTPAPQLLATILIYRTVYYVLPAILALAACALARQSRTDAEQEKPLAVNQALWVAPRAEAGVIRQNGGALLWKKNMALATWSTGQSRVGLFDPLVGEMAPLLPALQKAGKDENRVACLYKVTAPAALAARSAGWSVIRIAQEAVLDPATFALESPTRRRLRRKLRQADKAQVYTQRETQLPVAEMARIDAEWRARRGGARAGTMGCFCPDYLAGQTVFLAYLDDRLVGFVSFHTSAHEWCLDLMRSRETAPDGTMHALVRHALTAAADAGVPRLSLAAVTDVQALQRGPLARLWHKIAAGHGTNGLRQFKSSFAPRWQPLYAAAPNRYALWLSLADIARAIHHPAPQPASAPPHNEDEYNEVAPILAS